MLHGVVDQSSNKRSGSDDDVTKQFKREFADRARDPAAFREFMSDVFGPGHDAAKAEELRKRALDGDFAWLPKVQRVDASVLGGANGAYNAAEGVVYINRDLDSATAASTFVEEAGHHIDAQINTVDTAGDEGEMFRRLLAGEKLSASQIADIRAEDDKGVIEVDGKMVEVEFWNPFKAVAKAVKGVAKAVASVAKGVARSVTNVVKGVVEGATGFAKNLLRLRFADAFGAALNGFDRAVFGGVESLINGVMDGVGAALDGVADALPGVVGKAFRKVARWGVQAVRGLYNGAVDFARTFFRSAGEAFIGLGRGLEDAAKHIVRGEWGAALKSLGQGVAKFYSAPFVAVVDTSAARLQMFGALFSEPARSLNESEREHLERVFGDSVDLDLVQIKRHDVTHALTMRAHVVGNTIYLPETVGDPAQAVFNDDGTLTEVGRALLVHEASHVWQNQRLGPSYKSKALFAQTLGALGVLGKSTNNSDPAYDWAPAVGSRVPFAHLNPEQQAHLLEDAGLAIVDGRLQIEDGPTRIYMLAALEQVSPGAASRLADARDAELARKLAAKWPAPRNTWAGKIR